MNKKEITEKRAYKKPKLISIELQSDEVLVTGCKTYDVGNADHSMPSCNPGVCFEVGS